MQRIRENAGLAALAISIASLVLAGSGAASATRGSGGGAAQGSHGATPGSSGATPGSHGATPDSHGATPGSHGTPHGSHRPTGHRARPGGTGYASYHVSASPRAHSLLLLNGKGKFAPAAIPTVKNAEELDGMKVETLSSCEPDTVDLGTWCLMSAPYPLTNTQLGQNNYFWASQKCVELGGYLPTAAQLIGAAKRVRLESTIHDSPLTATIDEDPSVGLKDQREMTSTLVTTVAGSDAAGSEGVSVGSTGNPRTSEPNPVPLPANPAPATLQYVTVYSNGTKGGFAGSEPVSAPENFRCAFNKVPGAIDKEES
ncbi:MAG TPA: hypothetical protein VMS02_10035 [Solirubrobacteraceae bacterium]|nr:hypothetical protein [Solirubrobacteraceae bacterium]